LDTGVTGDGGVKNVSGFTSNVYFHRSPAIIRGQIETEEEVRPMGPVVFNRTRVKQEDRYGKRRK
jgi:hypothetical protein